MKNDDESAVKRGSLQGMIQAVRRSISMQLALALLLISSWGSAGADATAAAVRELSSNSDFRVRTQAALSLGSSEDPKAVEPLCRALEDSKSAVRAAAAAALGKLARGGGDCLQEHLDKESVDSVKQAIEKAIQSIRAGGGATDCTPDAKTRYYFSIGRIADNTQRRNSKVPEVIRLALSRAIMRQKGFCVGPDGETKAAYLKRVAGLKQVRGLLLVPRIQAPEYEDDSVTVRFEITIMTYPDRTLKGTVPIKLTQQGGVKKSERAEDELFRMAAERAVEKLLKNLDRIE